MFPNSALVIPLGRSCMSQRSSMHCRSFSESTERALFSSCDPCVDSSGPCRVVAFLWACKKCSTCI